MIFARCQYRDPVILATRGWNPGVKLSVLIRSLVGDLLHGAQFGDTSIHQSKSYDYNDVIPEQSSSASVRQAE